jgi:hypothetical protein
MPLAVRSFAMANALAKRVEHSLQTGGVSLRSRRPLGGQAPQWFKSLPSALLMRVSQVQLARAHGGLPMDLHFPLIRFAMPR